MLKGILLTIFEVGIIIVPFVFGMFFLLKSGASYEDAYEGSQLRFWGISKSKYKLMFRLLGVFCLMLSAFAVYRNYFAPDENIDKEIKKFWRDVDSSQQDNFLSMALLAAAIAIPTRMGSSRFPGKPLAVLGGKTVIERVYERCMQSKLSGRAVILTDSPEIIDFAAKIGAPALMTSPKCNSGTERIIEAFDKIGAEFVVNVQGDEPFISPELVDALIQKRAQTGCGLATAVSKITDAAALENENIVKVLRGEDGRSIYFSRSPLPHIRGEPDRAKWLGRAEYWRHIGIYGYSREALEKYAGFGECALEKREMLEQLRFVANGMKFEIVETEYESIGIDTPADLAAAEEFLRKAAI